MTLSPDLQDGVYVGLDEDDYFAQARLGSTDLVTLVSDPADWWYKSRHNPDRVLVTSEEREIGKALHKLILEGETAYNHCVSVSPYGDFRTKEARAWRDGELAAHRTVIDLDEDRRVRHMAALVLNHPQFAGPLREGLPEVSVFFHIDQHPMRARLDYLLPQFVIDLKTFGGHVRGRDLKDKSVCIVSDRKYDIQRYVYDVAREAMIALIRAGAMFKGDGRALQSHDDPALVAWLTLLAEEPDWHWVWMFYQRRDDRVGRAPVVLPVARTRGDRTSETGAMKTRVALANYDDFVRRFGLDAPWAVIAPMWEPHDHEFPPSMSDVPPPFNDHQDIAA